MQSMPVLSPMASVPLRKDTRRYKARALTISDGVHPHVTRETVPMQLNHQEMTLLLTDVSPYMIGSVIITKEKHVAAHCQNLTSQPRCTTTKNKLRSIIAKLGAQPIVFAEHAIQVCTNNRSVRCGHLNATGDRPWQLILSGSTVTLTYLPLSDPVTADEVSRQERHLLLLDPHSTT